MLHDRSGQPDNANSQEEANSENFVIAIDAPEFANKVKDQVRKRQKRMSNVADSGEKHSIIWEMLMAATMNAATFMGKNFLQNQNSIMNSTDLTLKKMFDISVKLVGEQEEISGLETIGWEKHSWKHLSLIGDETVINLQRAEVYVFSDSVCVLEGFINILSPTKLGKKGSDGSSPTKATETMTESMESRPNSSGIFSQDSQRCSSAVKSHIY